MQQLELDPLRGTGQKSLDAVVEGGELGVAVDRVGRLAILKDADAAHDPARLVAEDQYGLEGGMVAEEPGAPHYG